LKLEDGDKSTRKHKILTFDGVSRGVLLSI
jgi:hypothetical protein